MTNNVLTIHNRLFINQLHFYIMNFTYINYNG